MIATTRVAVLRTAAPTTDTLGDETYENDTDVAGYEDLPASIIEASRTVQDPATGTVRTVRQYTGRLPGNIELREGDRIRDNRTGRIYSIVEDEHTPRGISGRSSLTLTLRRTGG